MPKFKNNGFRGACHAMSLRPASILPIVSEHVIRISHGTQPNFRFLLLRVVIPRYRPVSGWAGGKSPRNLDIGIFGPTIVAQSTHHDHIERPMKKIQ